MWNSIPMKNAPITTEQILDHFINKHFCTLLNKFRYVVKVVFVYMYLPLESLQNMHMGIKPWLKFDVSKLKFTSIMQILFRFPIMRPQEIQFVPI